MYDPSLSRTTLLNVISGLLTPTNGKVLYDGDQRLEKLGLIHRLLALENGNGSLHTHSGVYAFAV